MKISIISLSTLFALTMASKNQSTENSTIKKQDFSLRSKVRNLKHQSNGLEAYQNYKKCEHKICDPMLKGSCSKCTQDCLNDPELSRFFRGASMVCYWRVCMEGRECAGVDVAGYKKCLWECADKFEVKE